MNIILFSSKPYDRASFQALALPGDWQLQFQDCLLTADTAALAEGCEVVCAFINDNLSAPVLERDWAKRSGVGWVGKNTLLIHPKAGSYFFLAELILDLDLVYDTPIKDYCGTCTKCIDACPTDAILDNKVIDGSKCISYFTIELKDAFPQEMKNNFDNWAFGCDVCQEVCPWNRFSKPTTESNFHPREGLLEMKSEEWFEITEEVFDKVFKDSAVQRTGFKGLKRNLEFLKKK